MAAESTGLQDIEGQEIDSNWDEVCHPYHLQTSGANVLLGR